MITSNEYLRNSDLQKDLLAAFSALDHSITTAMQPEELQAAFARLLLRLSVLCDVHRPGTARRFLEEIQAAEGENFLEVALSFVEIGKRAESETERAMVGRRELQQEILHFSRIVDLQESGEPLQNKRLRNSKLIPEPLKVLCELITVARARVLQRGKRLALPRSRQDRQRQFEFGAEHMLVCDREPSDYLLILRGGDLPLRRDLAFLFASLLTYLTPSESVSALTVHMLETQLYGTGLAMALVEPDTAGTCSITRWTHEKPAQGADNLETCLTHLVDRQLIASHTDEGALCVACSPVLTTQFDPVDPRGMVRMELKGHDGADDFHLHLSSLSQALQTEEAIALAALALFKARCQASITSIESGHVHLDRQLDGDQMLGANIGHALFRHLAQVQAPPPRLHPMVDDDHVLVQLAARDYQAFFEATHPGAPFELIPESSPIIRAIACALFVVISEQPAKAKHLILQGGNLLLKLPDENLLCEIFEDFQGKCDNGCVFFEVALVVYRSDPQYFSEAFHGHFGLEEDVHQRVLQALDPVQPHDEIIEGLKRYGAQFASVTNPHNPSRFFVDLVSSFLNRQEQLTVHLNVLEDYYEAQQLKVRKLLRYLQVPAQLWSLHFNRLTGRVHFERRAQPRPE